MTKYSNSDEMDKKSEPTLKVSDGLIFTFLVSIPFQPFGIFGILNSTNQFNALMIYLGVAFLVAVILQIFRKMTAFLLLAVLAEYSMFILGTNTERNFGVAQMNLVNIVATGALFGALVRGVLISIFPKVQKFLGK
ncbi:hypothetical protein [Rothia nasimurium]|uniref:hypothetical protein n=1 Tax=Rothia nasimurium TaxID=85336 RepID=UPI001F220FB5|nr:hypothetical protein [Rothia nasimurium]